VSGNAFSERVLTVVFPGCLRPLTIPSKLGSYSASTLYHLVAVPPEAPGSLDYGDLDIVVCQPKNIKEDFLSSERVTFAEIEEALGSVQSPLTRRLYIQLRDTHPTGRNPALCSRPEDS